MSDAKDTLLRQLALLCLIPREPQRRATSTLLEKLREQGFSVSQRTLQRDLVNLSRAFALQCETQASGNRWSYLRDAPLDLAAMDTPTALALYLAEGHLKPLLPQIVLDQLASQFNRARNHLDGLQRNELAHWARRVSNSRNQRRSSSATRLRPVRSTAYLPSLNNTGFGRRCCNWGKPLTLSKPVFAYWPTGWPDDRNCSSRQGML